MRTVQLGQWSCAWDVNNNIVNLRKVKEISFKVSLGSAIASITETCYNTVDNCYNRRQAVVLVYPVV